MGAGGKGERCRCAHRCYSAGMHFDRLRFGQSVFRFGVGGLIGNTARASALPCLLRQMLKPVIFAAVSDRHVGIAPGFYATMSAFAVVPRYFSRCAR
ncbi:hypothetical protein GGS21DRAFT_153483 [Xylaria nigripes]|nr:hypothetical protein GGS21DRAFT_153483 [Xylaria nigripes]